MDFVDLSEIYRAMSGDNFDFDADTEPDEGSSFEVILVHGLRRAQTNESKNELRIWLRRVVRSSHKGCEDPTTVYVAFDGLAILQGGRREFKNLCYILSKQLEKRQWQRVNRPKQLVFIADGLGSLVIKEILARESCLDLANATSRILQLENGNVDPKEWDSYAYGLAKYLDSSARGFKFPFELLVETQKNFDGRMQTFVGDPVVKRPAKVAVSTSLGNTKQRLPLSGRTFWPSPLAEDRKDVERLLIQQLQCCSSESPPVPSGDLVGGHYSAASRKEESNTTLDPMISEMASMNLQKDNGSTHGEAERIRLVSRDLTEHSPSPSIWNEHVEYAKILFPYAEWLFESGDLDEARRAYQHCETKLNFTMTDLTFLFDVKLRSAIVQLEQGELAGATRALCNLERSATDSLLTNHQIFEIQRWKSLALCRQGKYPEAKRIFQCLMRSRTQAEAAAFPWDVYRDLALVLSFNDDFQRAHEAIRLAEQRFPSASGLKGNEQVQQKGQATARFVSSEKDEAKFPTTPIDPATRLDERSGHKFTVEFVKATTWMLQGDFKLALEHSDLAIRRMSPTLGPTHFRTTEARSLHATLLMRLGRLDEAKKCCAAVIWDIQKRLGYGHFSTYQPLATLGSICRLKGRFEEAKRAAIRVRDYLGKLETVENTVLPQVLEAHSELAAVHFDMGCLDEAESCLDALLKISSLTLPNNHPSRLAYRSQLSWVHYKQGRLAEARSETEALLQIHLSNFSASESSTGKLPLQEVVKILEEALKDRTAAALISTVHCHALVQRDADPPAFSSAETLLKIVREAGERTYDSNHWILLAIRHDLAVTQRMLRVTDDECLAELNDIFKQRRDLLSPRHPDCLASRHEIALTKLRRGDEAGLAELAEVYALRRSVLTPRHPDTYQSLSELALAYRKYYYPRDAERMQEALIKMQDDVKYLSASKKLQNKAKLASMQSLNGKLKLAQGNLEEAISELKREQGDHGYLLLGYEHNLAEIYRDQGQIGKAEAVLQGIIHSLTGPDSMKTNAWFKLALLSLDSGKIHESRERQERGEEALQATNSLRQGKGEEAFPAMDSLRQRVDMQIIAFMRDLALKMHAMDRVTDAVTLLTKTWRQSRRILGPDDPRTQDLAATVTEWRESMS